MSLVAVLLLGIVFVPGAHAQGTISTTVSPPNVLLSYQVELQENATTLTPSRVFVNGSNESSLPVRLSIEQAMQKVEPSVHLDPASFEYSAVIRQLSAASGMWVISENFTGTVSGANSGTAGTATYDLSFLSFDMKDLVESKDTTEWNAVGPAYLVGPIDSQGLHTTFYLDKNFARGGPYSNAVIPGNTTENFYLYDFSWLPKIDQWKNTSSFLDSSTVYTMSAKTLGAGSGLPYNLTMGLKSPEGTLITSLVAFYNPTFEIVAPARAVASGTKLTYDVPVVAELVMPAIIIVAVAAFVGAYFWERRLSAPQPQYRKKPARR